MKTILAGLLMIISMTAMAQKKYDVSKDEKEGGQVFNGPITFTDLDNETSFTWLKTGAEEYNPDEKTLAYLRSTLKNYNMVVFLGTWCDDSHYLVPKLEKLLGMTDYPEAQLTMYGVNRAKTTKGGEEKKYDITFVPTIILLKGGKEVGRIKETVEKSIEWDLVAIIEKDMGKH